MELRTSVRAGVAGPSARGVRAVLAAVLTAAGLFTVSWERLGNVPLGPYNVKLPALLLTAAAVAGAPAWLHVVRRLLRSGRAVDRLVVGAGALLIVWLAVRALIAVPLGPGLAQIAAEVTGAVAPLLAVLAVVARRGDAIWALGWFVAGAIVASAFGLYQLLAFYTGLPQGIDYTGVGTSGTGGRISAFSYEPAYFAYFLVLAAGALLARSALACRPVPWAPVIFLGLVLTFANVRALVFLLPTVAVLLLVGWRGGRRSFVRLGVAAAVCIALSFVEPGLDAVLSRPVAEPSGAVSSVPSVAPTTEPSRSARLHRSAPAAPPPPSLLDPNEQSSNAPRLDLYRAVLRVDLGSPVIGVGPGHLGAALAHDGYVPGNQRGVVVANNIWLQAVADGGAPALLLELAVVVGVAIRWWRLRRRPMQPLASVWLAVVLVGGMLTSYFFDIKLWVVLGLLLATGLQPTGEPSAEA